MKPATPRKSISIRAAFIGTATLMPLVATFATEALYIIGPSSIIGPLSAMLPTEFGLSLVGGATFTLVFWVLVAMSFLPNTTVSGADAYSFNLLVNRLWRLETWLPASPEGLIDLTEPSPQETEVVLSPSSTQPASRPVLSKYNSINAREMLNYTLAARESLDEGGANWVTGVGYVNVSRLLHRAEELLVMFEPDEIVIADGSRAQVAIANSMIANQEYYLSTLDEALDAIDPDRIQHFVPDGKSFQKKRASSAAASTPPPPLSSKGARAAIHEVIYALDEFQDDQWEKLVHARNQLLRLIVLTGLILYILLAFMLLTNVQTLVLVAATFFFLIGAGIGLFSRLYEQARVESSIDNVRLATVRLMAALLFSGLAAIGGVVVMQKVAGSPSGPPLEISLFNILTAAAFGLTPNLFFNAIQRQVAAVDKGSR